MAEFPTIAELLALAVAAGEGAVGALERVTRLSQRRAVAASWAGRSPTPAPAPRWSQALQGIAARTSLPPLARFVDGVAIAVERGTPLADVLRAQAVDVREAGKRALLEAGGRKEIAMMVPVVFLVLPVTVLFALFPGFYRLQLLELKKQSSEGVVGHVEGHRTVCPMWLLRCTRVLSVRGRDNDGGRDRGDVPGWVLVTIMTAGLVTALWLVADDKLKQLFSDALDGVTGNAP